MKEKPTARNFSHWVHKNNKRLKNNKVKSFLINKKSLRVFRRERGDEASPAFAGTKSYLGDYIAVPSES